MATSKPRKKVNKGPTQKKTKKSILPYLKEWAVGYYRIRREDTTNDAPMEEVDGFLRPWPPSKPVHLLTRSMEEDAEMAALVHSYRWRGLVISFCVDNNGNPYRSFLIGESVQAFPAYQEGIRPFILMLYKENEKTINLKHLVARTVFFIPVNKWPMGHLIRKFKDELGITDQDIEQLEALYEQPPESKYFGTFDDLDLDEKINRVYREMDMEKRGLTLDGRKL